MDNIKQIKIPCLQEDILDLYQKCENYQEAEMLQEQIRDIVEIILKGDFLKGDFLLSHLNSSLENYPKR